MTEPRRILVMEDDTVLRTVLNDLFESEGYDVRLATDGASGLALLKEWRPDVILLDLMMPMMDGSAFLEQQPIAELPPVLLLSAVRDLEERARQLGAAGFVRKPFDLDDLLATVSRAIDG